MSHTLSEMTLLLLNTNANMTIDAAIEGAKKILIADREFAKSAPTSS